jgi:hypothetical protein
MVKTLRSCFGKSGRAIIGLGAARVIVVMSTTAWLCLLDQAEAGCNLPAGKKVDISVSDTVVCVGDSVDVTVANVSGGASGDTVHLDVTTGAGLVTPSGSSIPILVDGPAKTFSADFAGEVTIKIAEGTAGKCSRTFTIIEVDLDGEEPDGSGGFDAVADDLEYSVGVYLATSESRLVVQDPGVDYGDLTLTWLSPVVTGKKLEIDGNSTGTYTIDCSTVSTWPVILIVKTLEFTGGSWTEQEWDTVDTVDVALDHSAVPGCQDEVKLACSKLTEVYVYDSAIPNDGHWFRRPEWNPCKYGTGEEPFHVQRHGEDLKIVIGFKPPGVASAVRWKVECITAGSTATPSEDAFGPGAFDLSTLTIPSGRGLTSVVDFRLWAGIDGNGDLDIDDPGESPYDLSIPVHVVVDTEANAA